MGCSACSASKGQGLTDQMFFPSSREKRNARLRNEEFTELLLDLSKVPILRYMPKEQRPMLAASAVAVTFRPGHVVIEQGDEGNELYFIKEGEALIYAELPEGNVVNIAKVMTGDYFGHHSGLTGQPRDTTVIAATMLECLRVDGDRFQELGLHTRLRKFPRRQAMHQDVTEEPSQNGGSIKGVEETDFIVSAIMQNKALQKLCMTKQIAAKLAEVALLEGVKTGTEIISQGDDGKNFYVVASGAFDVFTNLNTESTEATQAVRKIMKKVATIERGGSFGELALLHGTKRAATVRSTMYSSVWVIDRGNFKHTLMKVSETVASEYEELLARVPILNALLQSERKAVANAMKKVDFNENDIVLQQGEPGYTFYILIEGEVEISKDGSVLKQLSASHSSVHYFGERALVNSEPRSATIKVISPRAAALALDKVPFDCLLDSVRQHFSEEKNAEKAGTRPESAATLEEGGWEDVSMKDLRSIGILGTGAFSRVRLHEHEKTGKTFAVKVISKGYIVKTRMQANAINEKVILENVRSPFIIRLYKTSRSRQALFFILEPCLGGEVFTLYERRHLHGLEYPAQYFAASVTLAFEHLHERFVVYRDLKPENLLLDSAGHMKVTDMGLAKFTLGKTYTTCGTREYFAPEVIMCNGQTPAVDWWTLGILIYEFMTGGTPFWSSNDLDMYQRVLNGVDCVTFPAKAKGLPEEIIKDLLRREPTERLPMGAQGVNTIKRHPWFKTFDWEALINQTLRPPYRPTVRSNKDLQNFDVDTTNRSIQWMHYQDDGSGWDSCF